MTTRVAALVVIILFGGVARAAEDPLPSWNDTPARVAIIAFVAVSSQVSPDFVAPDGRIAVFDNDGTLWVEQPVYTQLAFAMDRVKALAPAHPQWTHQQPFKALLENNLAALADAGVAGIVQLVMATHAGITTDEFAATVAGWLATARHPRFQRLYTQLVYQPMLELLAYLHANGFTVWIQHLQVAVGVAEGGDRAVSNEFVDAHRLAGLVIDEFDLGEAQHHLPAGRWCR